MSAIGKQVQVFYRPPCSDQWDGYPELEPNGLAVLLGFGTYSTRYGSEVSAIVTRPDGSVENVPVSHIRFVEPIEPFDGRDE